MRRVLSTLRTPAERPASAVAAVILTAAAVTVFGALVFAIGGL